MAVKQKMASKRPGFKYQPRTAEDIKQRAERRGAGQFDSIFKQNVDSWRPKDGENVIRILPPTWDGHEHYGYDIWVHSFVGADKSTYLCPQKMLSKPCPICAAAREARAAGEEEEAKQLTVSSQVAVWIIDRDDEDKASPSIYTMSFTMDKNILALCATNKRTGKVLLIDHPDEGYDVFFTRTGKGLNTRYIGLAIDRESSPILPDQDEQDKVLEFIQDNPIPDVLNYYSEDYLRKMIEGGAGERDEELDDAEEPTPRRSAPRAGAKPVARRPTRSEEPEEEEDDADLPPRKSARPAASAKRRPEPEDEDVEEDVEDEDIEGADEDSESPPRRSARPARRQELDEEDVDVEDEPPPRRRGRPEPDEAEEDIEDVEDEDPPPRRSAKPEARTRPVTRRR